LEQLDQSEYIRQARALLGSEQVKQGRIPMWLKRRLVQAVKDGRLESRWPAELRFAEDILQNDAPTRGWLDHWGSARSSRCYVKGGMFVSEPYDLCPDKMVKIDQFALLLQLDWHVLAKSWHYPGSTFRLEFWPREPR
jgi:hypothetical protein